MPELKIEELTKVAKDALYVGVGLTVIAFQKAQVQRQELQKRLQTQMGDAKSPVAGLSKLVEERIKLVEERMSGVETRVESLLDQLEGRLPAQAQDVARQARSAAKEARTQVRELVGRAS